MEKINVAELLKNCPTGMELDSTMFEKVTFVRVQMDRQFPIEIAVNGIRSKYLTKEGCFHDRTLLPEAKCVIFPKGKTTWEGFVPPCQFKDGDIVALDTEKGAQLFIFKEYIYNHDYVQCYMMLDCGGEIGFEIGDYYVERFATEEEKEKLFQAIKENGYRWNTKTKTLEKLVGPQFNVEDWIIRNNKYTGIPIKVIEFNDCYSCELNGEIVNLTRNDIHNNFHLWTIQDAKDGDVLVDKDNNIGIFQKFEGIYWYSYIYLGCDGKLRGFSIGGSHKQTDVHPATKEQRDLLFQKIKEAGYKWNSETKTLEKLIIPKFKVGDRIKHIVGREEVATVVGVEELHYNLNSKVGTSSFSISLQHEWELVPKKFDITTLKPFDEVLVRDNSSGRWDITFYELYDNTNSCYPHRTLGGNIYKYCIPYEGNEHLLGKVEDCKNFYKIWE